jgi:hypothetical protein
MTTNQPVGFALVAEKIKATDMRPFIKWEGAIVGELPDGFVIRALDFPTDYITEGVLMGHCLGVVRNHYRNYHCFHLESADKLSHATIVAFPGVEAKRVYEIRGRDNRAPRADYRVMIQPWLEQAGIEGDDVSGYLGEPDDDTDYHEKGIITSVVTGLEGIYE